MKRKKAPYRRKFILVCGQHYKYSTCLTIFFVLSVKMELFGPLPTEVNASISNSYSVYLSSPVTSHTTNYRHSNEIITLPNLSHTIFHCPFYRNRTLRSITIRRKSQDLKFIFCVLIKPGDTSTKCRFPTYSHGCYWHTRTFLCVKQFKPCNSCMSSMDWWQLPGSCNAGRRCCSQLEGSRGLWWNWNKHEEM